MPTPVNVSLDLTHFEYEVLSYALTAWQEKLESVPNLRQLATVKDLQNRVQIAYWREGA